jgi:hypothetical protein
MLSHIYEIIHDAEGENKKTAIAKVAEKLHNVIDGNSGAVNE